MPVMPGGGLRPNGGQVADVGTVLPATLAPLVGGTPLFPLADVGSIDLYVSCSIE